MNFNLRHIIYELSEEEFGEYLTERDIRLILWTIAKEYEEAIKKRKVIPIERTEYDREIVNKLWKILKRLDEKLLNLRTLIDFVQMVRVRDYTLLLQTKPHLDRIYQLAVEVKRRSTPIVSFLGYPIMQSELYISDNILEKPSSISTDLDESSMNDNILFNLESQTYSESVNLSLDEIEKMKEDIIEKVNGKEFSLDELPRIFKSWELELLSQMLLSNELESEIKGNIIKFGRIKPKGVDITVKLRVEHNE